MMLLYITFFFLTLYHFKVGRRVEYMLLILRQIEVKTSTLSNIYT